MFDTHCHLNFSAFKDIVPKIVADARRVGVEYLLIPGTDIETSVEAVKLANNYENIFAAVGIHPHHVFEMTSSITLDKSLHSSSGFPPFGHPKSHASSYLRSLLLPHILKIEKMLQSRKVVAIGEVGIDRHEYKKTKYEEYKIDESFIKMQKELLREQVKLAIIHDKSLILHNREAKTDTLAVLNEIWDKKLEGRTVFHCCEPDLELLEFSKSHKIFIGVDGDVTYSAEKQEFIKLVPLEMLVLETDSPFLVPEPLRLQNIFPNEPKNIKIIVEFLSKLLGILPPKLIEITTNNSRRLFRLHN